MDKRRRAALINSLSGFKPANLVGTADGNGQTNLAIMSSAVHLGSDPALLALIVRPGGEERHTLANILATGHYNCNHVTAPLVEAAHQTAARYHRDVSEFDAAGFTAEWREGLDAPLVAEADIRMGMALREHQHLRINDTHLVIGEIILAEVPDHCLRDDGAVDLEQADTVALSGLDTYYRPCTFKRMAYAKPGLLPRVIQTPQRNAGTAR
jgi:flavin reductase (DIM6/NTAB) family NADH-FMN oxidoreductase RutF